MKLENKNRFSILYFLILLSVIFLIHALLFQQKVEDLSYAEFKELIKQKGRIEQCTLSSNHIKGIYIKDKKIWQETVANQKPKNLLEKKEQHQGNKFFPDAFEAKKGRVQFSVVRVYQDPELIKLLEKNGVDFKGDIESNWITALFSWIVPIAFFVIIWIFLMRRIGNYGKDVMSFVKTKAKISAEENTKTSFEDVAGCKEAKEDLSEIVAFLKSPEKFKQLGGKIPKGALLVGPPGTGKTLLARATAGEAGVPFFNISGSEFVEMFVGVGASRVRDLFQQAKSSNPCIIFIDEIDAVGRHRGAGLGGGHDEREQTLNQLLSEMDGFEVNNGIIVLAATNRPDILDPALLRPGRFDRRVTIDQPDIKGREEILKIHSKGKPLSKDIKLESLAQRTPGFSGADLANVMNEAALLASRKNKKVIEQEDISEAIERVIAGPQRRSRLITEKEKKITAYHEVGHAMTAELIPEADPVHKLSIIPRGSALGYTLSLPEEDKYNKTKQELIAKICVFLAGRVAEEVGLQVISTGAQNDFEHVTNIARSIVARFGMNQKLGPMAFEKDDSYVFLGRNFDKKTYFSSSTLDEIDKEVRSLVMKCYEKTTKLITEHKSALGKIVEVIIKEESIEGDAFRELLKKYDVIDNSHKKSCCKDDTDKKNTEDEATDDNKE